MGRRGRAGFGIESCDCDPLPDDVRCEPLSPELRRRLYTALNDKTRWQEFDCWLKNVCDQLNSIPFQIPGKDEDGASVVSKPTESDPFLAGQPVYVDASGYARPATFANSVTVDVIGLALEDAPIMDTVCVVTSGLLELMDWTSIIGAMLLTPGASYYLTSTGGLTTSIPQPGVDDWNVRVGKACSGTKMVLDPRDPWQLTC